MSTEQEDLLLSESEGIRKRMRYISLGSSARSLLLIFLTFGTMFVCSRMSAPSLRDLNIVLPLVWGAVLLLATFQMRFTAAFTWELKWGIPKHIDPLDLTEFMQVIAAQIWCAICFLATAICFVLALQYLDMKT